MAARRDGLATILAVFYGLPSLAYAFGRDQAIFYYVGREWAAGRVPYRDAFDIKPPGIYAVYALAGRLLGVQLWAIRIVELVAVLAMGWCAACAVRRDTPRRAGETGAVILVTSGFYYTVFDYWDTGQVEFWEGLFALAGYVAAERVRNWRLAAAVAGVCGATAVMFKTPAALILPVALFVVMARAYRAPQDGRLGRKALQALTAGLIHGLTAAAVIAVVLGYFALRGALPALQELGGYTSTYVRNTSASLPDALSAIKFLWGEIFKCWITLLSLGWLTGLVLAARRRAWPVFCGALLAPLLTLLAACSVAAQLKLWSYHWVVLTPFLVLGFAYGLAELARRDQRLPLQVAVAMVLIGYLWAPRWVTSDRVTYRSYTQSFWSYLRGQTRRSAFLQQFVGPYNYNYLTQERVGEQIGELAQPGDWLHVRGFEPAIYANARLASPSRFASEAPLTAPNLTFNRAAWVAEHDAILWRMRPRFFVSFGGARDDIANIEAHGYHRLGELPPFIWFERRPEHRRP